jgi:carboxymethylenebutenolidase
MTQDALAYVDFLERTVQGPMGVVGYCLTGKMAIHTAAAASDRVAACASFHGGNLYIDEPTSPHKLLSRITARLYFGYATDDKSMPVDAIVNFDAALSAWGGAYESETYTAAHGWTVPGREVYDAEQAERHFAKLKSLFSETLL